MLFNVYPIRVLQCPQGYDSVSFHKVFRPETLFCSQIYELVCTVGYWAESARLLIVQNCARHGEFEEWTIRLSDDKITEKSETVIHWTVST